MEILSPGLLNKIYLQIYPDLQAYKNLDEAGFGSHIY